MFELPRHASYQTIASPWLELIPIHWRTVRMKSAVRERAMKGYPDEPLLAATQSRGVIRKSDYGARTVTATKDLHHLKLVEVGDFVISLRSFQGGIERCYHRGIISPAYTVLTATSHTYRDYLTHLFKSKPFVSSLTLAVTGIREGQNIDYSKLSVEMLPMPPADEQAAIVKYLIHANARIDKAIAAKRRLVALLEEQIRALTEKLVLGSGRPEATVRRSGYEWLGDVPTEWEILPARFVFRVVNRPPVGTETKLSVTQSSGLVATTDMVERATQAQTFEKFQACLPGDMVLNKYKAHLGVFWGVPQPGLITPNYTVLRSARALVTEYFEFLFRTSRYLTALRSTVYGVTEGMSPLYAKDFYRIPLLFPAIDEQRSIVERVRSETANERSGIEKARAEAKLLQEFRARLVADVVTGQVDVREVVKSLPALDADAVSEDQLGVIEELEINDVTEMSEV